MISLKAMCRDLGRRALQRLRLWRRGQLVQGSAQAAVRSRVAERRCAVRSTAEPDSGLPPAWVPVSRHVVRDPLRVIRRLAPLLPGGAEGMAVVATGEKGFRQLHFVRFGARGER